MGHLDNDGNDRSSEGLFETSSNGTLGHHNQFEQRQAGVSSHDGQWIAQQKLLQRQSASGGPLPTWGKVFLLSVVVALAAGYFWYSHWSAISTLPIRFHMDATSLETKSPALLTERCLNKATELSGGSYSREKLEYSYDASAHQCKAMNSYPLSTSLTKAENLSNTPWMMMWGFSLTLIASYGLMWIARRRKP